MKKDIHPESMPVCFIDVSTGKKFYTWSTLKPKANKTREKEVKDGVEYTIHYFDVTSDSHPAFTGKKRFVDPAGRLEKFENKFRIRGRRTSPSSV